MGKYDDLFDTGPTPSFSPGTTVPQVYVDEAAQQLAREKSSGVGKYADLFDEPAPAATSPSNDVARALEGTAQAKQALGLLLDPLTADWSQSQPITSVSGPARENPDELASVIPNPIARNAVAEAANTYLGFVPTSLSGAAHLAEPAITGVEDIGKTAGMIRDVLKGKGYEDAYKANFPESQAVPEAEKTPPYSRERFAAGFGPVASAVMLALGGKGLSPETPAPEPAPTEAIRAKLGQSETRLPVESDLAPSETPAVKGMLGRASPEAINEGSRPIDLQPSEPVQDLTQPAPQPKIPAADESASGTVPTQVISGEYQSGTAFSPLGDAIRRRINTVSDRGGSKADIEHPQKGIWPVINADTFYAYSYAKEQAAKFPDEPGYRKIIKAMERELPKLRDIPNAETNPSPAGTEATPAPETGSPALGKGVQTIAPAQEPANVPRSLDSGAGEPVVTSTKNAVTAGEREARGLPEAEQAARRDFGTVWDEAANLATKDPTLPSRLVDSLEAKPRALNDQENALLLRRQIEVQNEHDAAIQHQNDNPGNPDAQARLDAARNELQRVYDAGKAAGTETGRGLNARKMLAANDFSLSKMEAETRAVVNKGEPLSADQAAQIKALHERINAAESKLAGYEAQEQFRKELKAAQVAKQPRPEFLRQSYESAKARISNRRGRLYAGIDPTSLVDEAIVGAYHISRGVAKFADWSVEMVKEFGEAIKPHLQTIFEKARALHAETNRSRGPLTEEQRLAGAKSRASLQTEIIKHKLETGDITKPKRPGPIRPDRELLQLRGELQRHKDAFNTLLEKGRRANMSFGERAAETFVRGERAIKLTGIHTLGKLAGAGVTRLVTTPLEQAVGGILNKIPILSKIAAEAPREGRGSFRAETVGVGRGLVQGVRNIPKILKGVRTNEEALYGKQNFHYESGSVLDIPGRTHGALKSPFKEAERERSTILRQRQAQRKGLDPTEAATEQEIGQAAHMDAQRAIFMQDNILSDVFRGGIRMLENSKKFPTAGFYLAKTANFLLPIVKVPTNIAIETGVHLGGTLSGSGKLIGVMSRGLKNIKPEEADMIMRHYKKGAIGIGLFLTGYFNSSKFGGYYVEHDKRKSTDVRWGGARFNGVDIPAWLLHAPAFLVLQAGATFRRVLDKKGEKKTATLATVKGVVNDIPFVREMSVIDSMLAAGYEGDRERGSLLASSIVPQGVKDVATMLDQQDAQGNPVRRYPRNELDYIKMSIPGLRQEVPLHKAMMKRKLLLR